MLLKGFVLGLLGGETVIWMSIISVHAESVSTRKTETESSTWKGMTQGLSVSLYDSALLSLCHSSVSLYAYLYMSLILTSS